MTEDTLVPRGATLVISPGTTVLFDPAPSTKTDPAFWSPGTELAVDGRLEVRGEPDSPVSFGGSGPWGGLVGSPGAEIRVRHARIAGAEEGLLCAGASCELEEVEFANCEYGLVLGPRSRLWATGSRIRRCRVGVLGTRAAFRELGSLAVGESSDADRLSLPQGLRGVASVDRGLPRGRGIEYVGEYTVDADEVWRGDVTLAGRVTVTPGSVLTLEPGTRVSFRKVDSNGDGFGEAELLVLGGIRSLGTAALPVIFESAERDPLPGDWDKVSLIASEDPANVFRHTVFRHGVQALHAHFSRISAENCYFEKNLRGLQFQESERTRVSACVFASNKQAMRFRDSSVRVEACVFVDNLYAVHAFRTDLEFHGNTLEGNVLGGFLAKESSVSFERNLLRGNRDGTRMKDQGAVALIQGNLFLDSAEDALSLSSVDAMVQGNRFDGAGLDLASVAEAPVVFRANDFGTSGRDALHLGDSVDVDARRNFWGRGEPDRRIHDRRDDPALGLVRWDPELSSAPRLRLPDPHW